MGAYDGGHMLGNRSSLGDRQGLGQLLTHSVSYCQFMFQTLQQLVIMVLYLGCKGQRAVHWGLRLVLAEYREVDVAVC